MTKLSLSATAVIALSLVAGPALAAGVSDTDRAFLTKDVQGARYELALGKLAQRKAANPKVRGYADMIVHDHETANAQLMRLAREEGVSSPAGMTPDDAQKLAGMQGLQGAAFDQAYLKETTRINAQDQSESEQEMSSTSAPRIKAYLQKFASMDAKHKKLGEQLNSSLG